MQFKVVIYYNFINKHKLTNNFLYRYAIRCCLENNTEWLLFKSGVCLTKVTDAKQSYDISLAVKILLKEMLKQDNNFTAKKLLTRITYLRKENEEKPVLEQIKKYTFDENVYYST